MSDVLCGNFVTAIRNLRTPQGELAYCILPAGHPNQHQVTTKWWVDAEPLDNERPNDRTEVVESQLTSQLAPIHTDIPNRSTQ